MKGIQRSVRVLAACAVFGVAGLLTGCGGVPSSVSDTHADQITKWAAEVCPDGGYSVGGGERTSRYGTTDEGVKVTCDKTVPDSTNASVGPLVDSAEKMWNDAKMLKGIARDSNTNGYPEAYYRLKWADTGKEFSGFVGVNKDDDQWRPYLFFITD